MWTSIVERDAMQPRDDDYPDCERMVNGLHAIEDHCLRCENLICVCKPRPYPIRDHTGRILVSDFVHMA